jgi:hypothetical protein
MKKEDYSPTDCWPKRPPTLSNEEINYGENDHSTD